MSRFGYKYVPKSGTNEAGRDRARVRETGRCPVPLSRPVSPVPCPVSEAERKAEMMKDPRFAAWAAGQPGDAK